jgi:hypothetical protein
MWQQNLHSWWRVEDQLLLAVVRQLPLLLLLLLLLPLPDAG